MIKIVLEDNTMFSGETAADIVSQLKLDDWTAHATTAHYKKNMTRRVKNFHGQRISYRTDDEFLDELKRVGFIKFILRAA